MRLDLIRPVLIRSTTHYFDRQVIKAFLARAITTAEAVRILGGGGTGNVYRFDRPALEAWRRERLNRAEAIAALGVNARTFDARMRIGYLMPLGDTQGHRHWFARADVEGLKRVRPPAPRAPSVRNQRRTPGQATLF